MSIILAGQIFGVIIGLVFLFLGARRIWRQPSGFARPNAKKNGYYTVGEVIKAKIKRRVLP